VQGAAAGGHGVDAVMFAPVAGSGGTG